MSTATIIIQHEFLTRVRTKGFIISTILAPIGIVMLIALPLVLAQLQVPTQHRIAVVDQSGHSLAADLIAADTALFIRTADSPEALRQQVLNEELTGYLLIPPEALERDSVVLFTRGGGGLGLQEAVTTAVRSVFRRQRLQAHGADTTLLRLAEAQTKIERVKLTAERAERDQTAALTAIGYFLSFVVYMLLFVYGGIVMRSVIDEKTNRIVEILVSSARPFDIMFGKIIGVGAVGLFQLLLWVLLTMGAFTIAGSALLSFSGAASNAEAIAYYRSQDNDIAQLVLLAPSLSVGQIAGFVFYFLAGYIFYSTLFAGIAAAADTEQDVQTLQTPVSIFIVLPVLTMPIIMNAPESTLAVILSLVPMFSPILMVMRLFATEVPWWQLLASIVLLLGSIIGAIWLAGRIYRIGILRYGQRPSFRQILRWIAEG
ncbi:MAG: ABC transporter permease [Bacteroidota bacterium]|nr:ABC transporter permease [Bacteroidota bacterium]